MNKRTFITIVIFLMSVSVYSTNIEDYWGKYQSLTTGCNINFILSIDGISNLSVNDIGINKSSIKHDFLGIYGDAQFFQITFKDKEMYDNLIRLFIVKVNEKIVLVTGYYMRDKYIDEKTVVKKKCVVEFIWQPLDN